AEKPSVGKELARVLGCRKGGKGYLEGDKYIVTWAMGHLVELADPDAYDTKYKSWRLEDLPMLPGQMKYRIIRKTNRQFNLVKMQLKRKDVNNLIIATDAGREGELVARLIMKLSGWHGSFQRLWISSQTDSAIKDGFNNLKPGKNYDNLFKAAECRGEADWVIGLNITRALSCKYDVRLSAGRVQTPTINLIIQREKEIKDFIPKKYWTVDVNFGNFTAQWNAKSGNTRLFSEKEAESLREKLLAGKAKVFLLTKTKKSVPPPLAYNLTSLQRDANSRLGFSAKKTLSTLQVLYERYKIATYPRTDSSYITDDMVPTLKNRLKSMMETPLKSKAASLLSTDIRPGKRFVDNKKVTDHHAIIPTGEKIRMEQLDHDENRLMTIIMERFIEVLSPPEIRENMTVKIDMSGEYLVAKNSVQIVSGWRGVTVIRRSSEVDSNIYSGKLPVLEKGELLKVKSVELISGLTKPPSKYTEGTLLAAMENPGKYIDDPVLKKIISKGGLGTVATRADIIEKIISKGYILREGKELQPTSRGIELMEIVPAELRSPALTAVWEDRFTNISDGKENPADFLREIRKKAADLVKEVKSSSKKYEPREKTGKACPMCGKMLIPGKDRRGNKIFICHSLSCGYEETNQTRGDLPHRAGRREKAMNRRLISEYSDSSSTTSSFGDLIRASQERSKKE
ncbi:MAG: DNA topoisomerase 3, partial [Spirochaetales bacterium]|nr:DNA topoisomerase 3 [Spirochaetales bacterium]